MDEKVTSVEENQNSFGLKQAQLESIIRLLTLSPKVDEVLLFGSRAKGNFRKGSDVDIAIKGRELTLNDLLDLSNSLDTLWLPYRVDLVDYSKINEADLLSHIDRVGKTLYSRS